jgi:hypothetical protein
MRAARVHPLLKISESEQKLQARFSSAGKIERCYENKPRQDLLRNIIGL